MELFEVLKARAVVPVRDTFAMLFCKNGVDTSGLAPFGTSWNLFSPPPNGAEEMEFLNPGIYLKGKPEPKFFGFTCAESPETIDFTTVKTLRAYGEFTGATDPQTGTTVTGGMQVFSSVYSGGSMISSTKYAIAADGASSIEMDCTDFGGEQYLVLYADLTAVMTFTSLEFIYYPTEDITDLSESTWEQRNFETPTSYYITCNSAVPVPAGKSGIAVHLALAGRTSQTCLQFLDSGGNVIGYGDGWGVSASDGNNLCTHFQSIPEGAASVIIAAGYSPLNLYSVTPENLTKCVVCFS